MGLLKTGLKAAVAVKTADVIHERILDRQQEHAVAQGHPARAAAVAQPAAAAAMPAVGPVRGFAGHGGQAHAAQAAW